MTLFPTNSVLVWIASFEIRVNVCHLSPYWFLFGLLSLACRGLTTPQNNNFKFFLLYSKGILIDASHKTVSSLQQCSISETIFLILAGSLLHSFLVSFKWLKTFFFRSIDETVRAGARCVNAREIKKEAKKGWQLLSLLLEFQVKVMTWQKGTEACHIRVKKIKSFFRLNQSSWQNFFASCNLYCHPGIEFSRDLQTV